MTAVADGISVRVCHSAAQLIRSCDDLEGGVHGAKAEDECRRLCCAINSWSHAIHSEDVAEFLAVLARTFQVVSGPPAHIGQLYSHAAAALKPVANMMRQLPKPADFNGLMDIFGGLAESLRAFALPRVTDKDWFAMIGVEEFAMYIQTCTTALNGMTAFVLVITSWRVPTSEASLVRLCSQWVLVLLQVASAALQLASRTDTPAEMRSFYMVNTAWKEITGFAVSIPTENKPSLAPSFQCALWTAWQHLMVRVRSVALCTRFPWYSVCRIFVHKTFYLHLYCPRHASCGCSHSHAIL
jgi:hypothetical protein